MRGALTAELAILREFQFLLDLLLIALGVVRDVLAFGALQFHHGVLDISHTRSSLR